MDAYERVLGDAMAGDATLFAREDYVEEAWRIVDPVLKAGTPIHEYDKGAWGPVEMPRRFLPREAGRIRPRTTRRIFVSKKPVETEPPEINPFRDKNEAGSL